MAGRGLEGQQTVKKGRMERARKRKTGAILGRVALNVAGKAGARIAFKSIGKKGVKWRSA
mgnify:FL=1